jgi:hypothetical protein
MGISMFGDWNEWTMEKREQRGVMKRVYTVVLVSRDSSLPCRQGRKTKKSFAGISDLPSGCCVCPQLFALLQLQSRAGLRHGATGIHYIKSMNDS